ncbi:hypothetical protein ACH4OV_25125 [Streptomyces diastaticus]|uniref:hypothetical protein n=1 Tax=Streptomyces diastaticus TaxID=1956 RepID=UPI00379D417C
MADNIAQPSMRRALEVSTAFFGATTTGLMAGIITHACDADTLAVLAAGGGAFAATFSAGVKVFEYVRGES